MLSKLRGRSGGRYEVAPLMAPKTNTPWARTLLLCRERFSVQGHRALDNWEAFVGVGFGWGAAFSTLYIIYYTIIARVFSSRRSERCRT